MKGEKADDASTMTHGATRMSEFFRHGSPDERRAVFSAAARAAIAEQQEVIRRAKSDDTINS